MTRFFQKTLWERSDREINTSMPAQTGFSWPAAPNTERAEEGGTEVVREGASRGKQVAHPRLPRVWTTFLARERSSNKLPSNKFSVSPCLFSSVFGAAGPLTFCPHPGEKGASPVCAFSSFAVRFGPPFFSMSRRIGANRYGRWIWKRKPGRNGSAGTPRPTMHFVQKHARFDFPALCTNQRCAPAKREN